MGTADSAVGKIVIAGVLAEIAWSWPLSRSACEMRESNREHSSLFLRSLLL
jgi:hypothetical protein